MTGASGFVGGHLCAELERRGHELVTLARDGRGGRTLAVDADSATDAWAEALHGVHAIIHLAGIAHRRAGADDYQRVNVQWPEKLDRAATRAGVASLVAMSSIKVLGDSSERPLLETDAYRADDDPYGSSKIAMERALLDAAQGDAQLNRAVVRAPLVYGPGVKANFLTLLAWAERGRRGLPLPLGRATGLRSFIGVRNLCDLLITSIGHSGVIHGADGHDLSVPQLLVRLAVPEGRLVPVPASLLRGVLALAGHQSLFERLFLPLQLSQQHSNEKLKWTPPHETDALLEETLAWYRCRS